MEVVAKSKKRTFKLPDAMTILFILIILAAIATYIFPAGAYDTVVNEAGTKVIDPDSYHAIERTPTSFNSFLLAIPKGLANQSPVIFMLLLSMGGIQVLNESKAINAGIIKFISSRKNLEMPVIIALSIIFGCIGTFAGWNIEFVPFIPIVAAVVKAMGYDNMLALYMVVFPAASGWSCGVLNVFSTAILQGLAGLPIFSGWVYRLISFIIFMAISLAFILTYAKRYKKKQVEFAKDSSEDVDVATEDLEFTPRRKVTLIVSVLGLILLAYCTTAQGWGLSHVGGFWVVMGIIIGLINRNKIDEIIASFIQGFQSIVPVTIVIGMATAALIILEEGNLLHPIIHGMANTMQNTPRPLIGVIVFIFLTLMNALITGVHGKAVLLMPLLVPMADILGISQQIIVLAFIFGDGFSNWFWPTSAIGVASAGAADVPMDLWMKTTWKKFAIISVVAAALVFVAYLVGY